MLYKFSVLFVLLQKDLIHLNDEQTILICFRKKILITIHLTAKRHWVLVCMLLELKQMQYYDSHQRYGTSHQTFF